MIARFNFSFNYIIMHLNESKKGRKVRFRAASMRRERLFVQMHHVLDERFDDLLVRAVVVFNVLVPVSYTHLTLPTKRIV